MITLALAIVTLALAIVNLAIANLAIVMGNFSSSDSPDLALVIGKFS